MKILFLIPIAFLLTGCAFFSNPKTESLDNTAYYENRVPNNLTVDLEISGTYKETGKIEIINNDVYINYQRSVGEPQDQNFNDSFFAHLTEDGYEYYRRSVLHNTSWISFVPVSTDKENPNALDAINVLTSVSNSAFYDVFNVRVVNGTKPSGTRHLDDEPVRTYVLNDTSYYFSENMNMFLKISQNSDKNIDWSVKVKSYQDISAFTDSPSL